MCLACAGAVGLVHCLCEYFIVREGQGACIEFPFVRPGRFLRQIVGVEFRAVNAGAVFSRQARALVRAYAVRKNASAGLRKGINSGLRCGCGQAIRCP